MAQNYYYPDYQILDPRQMNADWTNQHHDPYYERSQTPDIMRGLNSAVHSNSLDRKQTKDYQPQLQYNSLPRRQYQQYDFKDFVEYPPIPSGERIHQNLGIPVSMPQCPSLPYHQGNIDHMSQPEVPYYHPQYMSDYSDSFRVSPIDPRHLGQIKTSTPCRSNASNDGLKSASNLENRLMSPKKCTMSNEELYSIIHKSKKKMNISDDNRPSPSLSPSSTSTTESGASSVNKYVKPESGYFANNRNNVKTTTNQRLSWSPNNDEAKRLDSMMRFDQSQTRQSWACNVNQNLLAGRKAPPQKPTSRLDFKRLLLMHGKPKINAPNNNKLTAVEQLKLSKQQLKQQHNEGGSDEQSILDLSQSPRSLRNHRAFILQAANSPNKNSANSSAKPVPKLLSPRSQWRFANPRTDILSSTIQEDCHEDENPSPGGESAAKKSENRNVFANLKRSLEKDLPKLSSSPQLTASQRLQAQRAQFLNSTPISTTTMSSNKFNSRMRPQERTDRYPISNSPPTLETAF